MKQSIGIIIILSAALVSFSQAYKPVADKSKISFTIKNFGINTGGTFSSPEGLINFDPSNPDKSSFEVSVDANTINTDIDARDNHLRKEEYFDVAHHPRISFRSDKITGSGKQGFSVSGKLTIKATTKDISFPFTAVAKDDGYLFEGSFEIDRREFKVGGNSLVLGDKVTVHLSVFAKKN